VATPLADALLFDVFGSVVDWRGSIVREGLALSQRAGAVCDWGAFADRWRRDGYLAPIGRIVRGEEVWRPVDELLSGQFELQAKEAGLLELDPAELAPLRSVWHHLEPWDDAVVGLARLAARHVVAPLSNGGFAMLTTMAKRAGLPWDCIISTELFRSYKPDPAAYLGGAALLGLDPGRVALVAAHSGDLRAARQAGLRTAYVPRPAEWGPDAPPPEAPDPSFDVVAPDFSSLAANLGC
jgi:2-haloacid dehalogenase